MSSCFFFGHPKSTNNRSLDSITFFGQVQSFILCTKKQRKKSKVFLLWSKRFWKWYLNYLGRKKTRLGQTCDCVIHSIRLAAGIKMPIFKTPKMKTRKKVRWLIFSPFPLGANWNALIIPTRRHSQSKHGHVSLIAANWINYLNCVFNSENCFLYFSSKVLKKKERKESRLN